MNNENNGIISYKINKYIYFAQIAEKAGRYNEMCYFL